MTLNKFLNLFNLNFFFVIRMPTSTGGPNAMVKCRVSTMALDTQPKFKNILLFPALKSKYSSKVQIHLISTF